jgi:hypothetical protein
MVLYNQMGFHYFIPSPLGGFWKVHGSHFLTVSFSPTLDEGRHVTRRLNLHTVWWRAIQERLGSFQRYLCFASLQRLDIG